MNEILKSRMDFLAVADKMKQIFRQTTLIDGSRYENDAEHSWHCALTALTLFDHCELENVDIDRVLKIIILHDLVEVYAGDTPAQDLAANIGKEEREREAADRLFALLPRGQAAEFRALWEEFDAMETNDSLYAAAADRLQSFFLIHNSGTGSAWVKYKATAERVKNRMLPVKAAIPSLWPWVEEAVRINIEKGFLTE